MRASFILNDEIQQRRISSTVESIRGLLSQLMSMKKIIVPELAADHSKDLEELLISELNDMDKAIQDAADKIEVRRLIIFSSLTFL